MSYLPSHEAFTAAQADAAPAPDSGLSALDWSVVALARRDSLASLDAPGPIARALGGLFGRGATSTLADPRLEALRRFAVHAWHRGYTLPVSEIARFKLAGFTIDQVEALLASIGATRAAPRSTRQAA